ILSEKHRVLLKVHASTADYADKHRFESGNQKATKDLAHFLDSWVPDLSIRVFCYKCGMKIFALSVSLWFLVSRFAFAQETSVEKAAVSELPSLLAIYKDIHAHPELSCYEEKTSVLMAK